MARNPKQDANLAPPFTSDQDRTAASENGKKGGVKSGQVRRKNRDARSAIRYLLKLAPIGNPANNLREMGFPENERTNMAALQARLYAMAMSGDIEAYKTLMRMAGYEPEENRRERESVASDRRRDMEVEAKLNALGSAPQNSDMALNMGDEDGKSDVVIYIPRMMSEEECQVTEEDSGTTEEEAEDTTPDS